MNIEESATKLSRNPLGIIALFILLIYGFATLLFGFVGNTFTEVQKWWFVIFLVIFPVLVLFVFAYLRLGMFALILAEIINVFVCVLINYTKLMYTLKKRPC